ncbi:hypothetical protein KIS4809_3832 [Bacillus sp. ZZV12-4809]|nr:hypothetical protein KIS4809_3832 [Bacillus sp. ZZV12-4809]
MLNAHKYFYPHIKNAYPHINLAMRTEFHAIRTEIDFSSDNSIRK